MREPFVKNHFKRFEISKNGWAYSYWCESTECEARSKEDTKTTNHCIPQGQADAPGKCSVCGKDAEHKVDFAHAN